MAGDQPSDDLDPATGATPAPQPAPADDDAPELPIDPIDPAANPLPAGTPPLPPVVPPAPPPASVAADAPPPTASGHAEPALDSPAAATPAAGTPATGTAAAGSPATATPDDGTEPATDAVDDLTGNPSHTIRTIAIAIVALVVLLGVGLLAIQKFRSDPAPRPSANDAATLAAAPSSPAPAAKPDITVAAILLSTSDDTSPCPGVARLMGTITVSGGATDVTYRWTHSDGRDSDIRTVRVDGTAQVTQDWAHPGQSSFLGQTQLEVITPSAARSGTLTFRGSCGLTASATPTS